MSRSKTDHSLDGYVETILRGSPTPLSVDELLDKIEQYCTVDSGARTAIDQAVNRIFQAVPVAPGQYGWLSHLLNGTSFRHPLEKQEIKKGFLMLDELEHAVFFPEFFQTHTPQQRTLTIEFIDGPTVTANAYIEQKTWSLSLGEEFGKWVNHVGGQHDDALIIHVVDSVEGRYMARLQPREARDEQAIEQRNITFALTAESLVADEKQSVRAIPAYELAARLIARDIFRDTVPPDDMHYVLHHFSVLKLGDDGYQSSDTSLPHERVIGGQELDIDSSAADGAMGLFGWQMEAPRGDMLWDWLKAADDAGESFPGDDEACLAYQQYLDRLEERGEFDPPLSHEEYHMIEAELEYMIALEVEFGWLLPEQDERKDELARRLMLDPDSLIGGELDPPDLDGPPYWEN